MSLSSVSSVWPSFGQDFSFMVPSFTSIAVTSLCLLAQNDSEKPEALCFPGWQFFGSSVIWFTVSPWYRTALPRVINDLLCTISRGHSSVSIIVDLSLCWNYTAHKVCCHSRFSVIPCSRFQSLLALSYVVRIGMCWLPRFKSLHNFWF